MASAVLSLTPTAPAFLPIAFVPLEKPERNNDPTNDPLGVGPVATGGLRAQGSPDRSQDLHGAGRYECRNHGIEPFARRRRDLSWIRGSTQSSPGTRHRKLPEAGRRRSFETDGYEFSTDRQRASGENRRRIRRKPATQPIRKPRGGTTPVDGGEVQIGPMCLAAPKTWVRERPPIGFILAQFSLPRAKGDPSDAQLTVAAAGENNPQGLYNLRKLQDRKPGEGSVEQLRIAGKEVVLLDSSTDDGDAGEGRYRVLNAMVFAGGKVYFVNCSGPERTVGERAGEFRDFLQTMKELD